MKKFLMLFVCSMFLVSLFVPAVKAADAPASYWHVGPVSFLWPILNVDATPYWKSITTGDEMFGVQTAFFSCPTNEAVIWGQKIPANFLKLSMGAITSLKANGMPYASATIKLAGLTNLDGREIAYVGVGYGHDFKELQDHLLVGASVKLW